MISTRQRPSLVIFDVNETLSDMSPMQQRFADVGAPPQLASTWFAGLLRDGFALTAAGVAVPFAEIAAGRLRVELAAVALNRPPEEAVEHILSGFSSLAVHPDVVDGVTALSALGLRLVTLTNGGTGVAQTLLEGAGIRDRFERLLSVQAAGVWKPAPGSYAYALRECHVEPADALLVAVHPWDIDGASRAGLATAWLNRSSQPYPGYFRRADVEAATLGDLADQLRALS